MRFGKTRGRRVAVLALLGMGAAAATALAAGGVSTSSKSKLIGHAGAVAAKCPKGKRAIGGGFAVPAAGIAQQDYPGGGRVWGVESYNPGPTNRKLTAYARCEPKGSGPLTVVSKSVTTSRSGPDPVLTSPVATCPAGTHVLSGGYKVRPPYTSGGGDKGEIAVFESRRTSSRSWRAKGGNEGKPTALVAFALCAGNGRGAVTQGSASQSVTGPSTTATASCPAGQHTIGGGFRVPSNAGIPRVQFSKPSGARDWKVNFGTTSPTAQKVTAYAYCEKG
ncbi:MAG: hypothetical protein U0R52_12805 [Solirubrobacterales bacterium]